MKKREIQDIQREFTQVCAALGDAEFRKDRVQEEIDGIKVQQARLNKEYTKLLEYSKAKEEAKAELETPLPAEVASSEQ